MSDEPQAEPTAPPADNATAGEPAEVAAPESLDDAQVGDAQLDDAQLDDGQLDDAQLDDGQLDDAQLDDAGGAGPTPSAVSSGLGVLKSVSSSLISSQAVKQDVRPIDASAGILDRIVPVEFRYDDRIWVDAVSTAERERRHVGFIAENIPTAAQICDVDGVPYDVDARAMVALLWAEVRRLSAEVAELRHTAPEQP